MREYQKTEQGEYALTQCTCDRCNRSLVGHDLAQIVERQEALHIDFVGGYGSIFGDGYRVTGDLCQQCVSEVLGSWLKIDSDQDHRGPILRQGT